MARCHYSRVSISIAVPHVTFELPMSQLTFARSEGASAALDQKRPIYHDTVERRRIHSHYRVIRNEMEDGGFETDCHYRNWWSWRV